MIEGLPDELIAQAAEAHCVRCKDQIVSSPSMLGATMVNSYSPATGARARSILCGACGLAFREFLQPELATDEFFQSIKTELHMRWA